MKTKANSNKYNKYKKPVVISYEEAVKERQKAVTYSRQPNQAQPSRTVNQPSYETKYKNKGSSHAESIFDYNFSLPPTDFRQPNRNKDRPNPSYFPGKNKGKESFNIGGYQGAYWGYNFWEVCSIIRVLYFLP